MIFLALQMCAVQSCHMVAEFNTRPPYKSGEIRRDLAAYDAMCASRPLKPPRGEIPHRNVRAGVIEAAKWRDKQIIGYVDDAPQAASRQRGLPQLFKQEINDK